MTDYEIEIPESLDLETAVSFSNQLNDLPGVDKYIFNFSKMDWVEPFSMLYLSSEIQRCRSRFKSKDFSAINHKSKIYAGHMGFFKSFGCDFGKTPGEATGSGRYIPISIFNSHLLREHAKKKYAAVGEFIEEKASQTAKVLTRKNSGEINETITYSIREIIRNVIEHSSSYNFGFCAQYWPTKHKVELAFLDRGVGIKKGLSKNPHLKINDDSEAIKIALMPGISGRTYKGVKKEKNNVWQNSGFGLYMTSRLCKEGGNFYIASGSSSLMLSGNNLSKIETSFQGTALRLTLDTNQLSTLSESLEVYRNDAYELNNKLKASNISASLASRMLSKDFKDNLTK